MTPTKKTRSKKYYKNLLAEHQQILAKMRVLICHVLDGISEQILPLEVSSISINTAPNSPENAPQTPQNHPFNHAHPIENEQNQSLNKNLEDLPKNTAAELPLYLSKESLSDVIIKLGRIITKILPQEEQLAKLAISDFEEDKRRQIKDLTGNNYEEDMKLLEQYFNEYATERGYIKAPTAKPEPQDTSPAHGTPQVIDWD